MPRNGQGVYSKPAGTTAVPNTKVESAKYNATIDDLVQDANAARPVTAGGTGSPTAAGARINMEVDRKVVYAAKSANYTAVADDNNAVLRFTAAATLSLTAAATLGANWHCWVFADGGAVTIDPNSSETIDGASTLVVPDGYSALIICTGSAFFSDYSDPAADAWVNQPIGVPIPLFDHITGVSAPPIDKNYRYIKLTASDTYNADVLTSESVSGSAPYVTATAVVSLADSPLNGRTVDLLNTERRYLRAGSSGTKRDDQIKAHSHSYYGTLNAGPGGSVYGVSNSGTVFSTQSFGGDETRVREIGVTYYMRIK